MADRTIKVCDLCSEVDASSYQVVFGDGALHVDLCADHALPLISLREEAPRSVFTPTGGRRRASQIVANPSAIQPGA